MQESLVLTSRLLSRSHKTGLVGSREQEKSVDRPHTPVRTTLQMKKRKMAASILGMHWTIYHQCQAIGPGKSE